MYKIIQLQDYEFMEKRINKVFDYFISHDGDIKGQSFYFLQYNNMNIAIISQTNRAPLIYHIKHGILVTIDNKVTFIFNKINTIKEYLIGLFIYESILTDDGIWVIGDVEVCNFDYLGNEIHRREIPSIIEDYSIEKDKIYIRTDEGEKFVVKMK